MARLRVLPTPKTCWLWPWTTHVPGSSSMPCSCSSVRRMGSLFSIGQLLPLHCTIVVSAAFLIPPSAQPIASDSQLGHSIGLSEVAMEIHRSLGVSRLVAQTVAHRRQSAHDRL